MARRGKVPSQLGFDFRCAMLTEGMDKTLRVYSSFDEMKADEYREWQALLGYERLKAVTELSMASYGFARNSQPKMDRTLVQVISITPTD